MNTITLLGRTTSAIELKQTQAGKSVASFSLAVKRPFAKDTTDFFNVVAFDSQAELLSRYVGKGNQVCIRGHLTTRQWEDKQGNKRTTTEVVADEVSYVGKGNQVCIRGHLTTRQWEDKQGNKRTTTEVVADEVSFVGNNESTAEPKNETYTYTSPAYNASAAPRFEDVADDGNLPF